MKLKSNTLSMNSVRFVLLAMVMAVVVTSCRNPEMPTPDPSVPENSTRIRMRLPEREEKTITRATSTDYEEGRIFNLMLMAFLETDDDNDPDNGRLIQRWVPSPDQIQIINNAATGGWDQATVDIELTNIRAGQRVSIFAVANYDSANSVMDIPESKLMAIEHIDDLDQEIYMKYSTVERGTNFVLSSLIRNITPTEGGVIDLELLAYEAKIKFDVNAIMRGTVDPDTGLADDYSGFNTKDFIFRPLKWRVVNAPKMFNLLNYDTDFIDPDTEVANYTADHFFTTDWYNFEGIGEQLGREFSFYILPMNFSEKSLPNGSLLKDYKDNAYDKFSDYIKGIGDPFIDGELPNTLDHMNHLWFSLRDKWEEYDPASGKNPLDWAASSRIPMYAPEFAPYVQFTAYIEFYQDAVLPGGTTIYDEKHVAEVTYTIHLGYDSKVTRPTTVEWDMLHTEDASKDADNRANASSQGGVKADGTTPWYKSDLRFGAEISNPDDFDVDANDYCNYHVYIRGVNHVELEAVNPDYEEAPGAEGSVFIPARYIELSPGYEQMIVTVHDDYVNSTLGWAISTPYGEWSSTFYNSTGVDVDMTTVDYQWAYARLHPKTEGTGTEKYYKIAYELDASGDPDYGVPYDPLKEAIAPLMEYPGTRFKKKERYYDAAWGDSKNNLGWTFHWGLKGLHSPENFHRADWERVKNEENTFYSGAGGKTYWELANDRMQALMDATLTGTDMMLNVNQLTSLVLLNLDNVEYNKTQTDPSKHYPTISDPTGLSVFSFYVDEYYYYQNPLELQAAKARGDGSELHVPEGGEWDKFTNTENRNISITYLPSTTPDFTSSVATTALSFEQTPIVTYYRRSSAGAAWPVQDKGANTSHAQLHEQKFVCYGMESQADNTRKTMYDGGRINVSVGTSGVGYRNNIFYNATNWRSGLHNTQLMILGENLPATSGQSGQTLADDVLWGDYFDHETGRMNSDVVGAWDCMRRNADENGNGKIDVSEIKWYIPSITQVSYSWIGANAFPLHAQLYPNSSWSTEQLFTMSSTHVMNGATPTIRMIWSHEGSSEGFLHDEWGTGNGPALTASIRCFRNLGGTRAYDSTLLTTFANGNDREFTAASRLVDTYEVAIPRRDGVVGTYDVNVGLISLLTIDPGAFRRFTQLTNLPEHHIFSDINRPWSAFEVMEVPTTLAGRNAVLKRQSFSSSYMLHRDVSRTSEYVCPPGWRIPNQRELTLIALLYPVGSTWGNTGLAVQSLSSSYLQQGGTTEVNPYEYIPYNSSSNVPTGQATTPLWPSTSKRRAVYMSNNNQGGYYRMRLYDGDDMDTTTGYARCVRDSDFVESVVGGGA